MRRTVSVVSFRPAHGLRARTFASPPNPVATEEVSAGKRGSAVAFSLTASVGAVVGAVAYKPDTVREKLSLPALRTLEPLIASIESATASLRAVPPGPAVPEKETSPEPLPTPEPDTKPVEKEELKASDTEKKAGIPKSAASKESSYSPSTSTVNESSKTQEKSSRQTSTSQVGDHIQYAHFIRAHYIGRFASIALKLCSGSHWSNYCDRSSDRIGSGCSGES